MRIPILRFLDSLNDVLLSNIHQEELRMFKFYKVRIVNNFSRL